MQLKMNVILRKDAVPTLFPHEKNNLKKERKGMAQVKMRNLEVSTTTLPINMKITTNKMKKSKIIFYLFF